MIKKSILGIALAIVVSSCDSTERDLGNKFVLYKGDENYPYSIGLDVGGGIQGLLDGDIVDYGYDSLHISVRMRNGTYYYLNKMDIKKQPGASSKNVMGPYSDVEYEQIAKVKKLPLLAHKL